MTETQTPVEANFDNKVDTATAKFNFRAVADETTGVKTKRDTIELSYARPSIEGLVNIFNSGGKGLALLMEAVDDVIVSRIRDVLTENPGMTAETFDHSQITWDTISNLEKEDRRSGIDKETWEAFGADYIETITSITKTTKEQAAYAAKIFLTKFAGLKNKKDTISKLVVRLSMYAEASANAEKFAECVDVLMKRADKLISAVEESLESNLGLDD
jgi:hypothetical protein